MSSFDDTQDPSKVSRAKPRDKTQENYLCPVSLTKMITLFRSNTILSHKDAQEFMAKQLGQLASKIEVIGTLTPNFALGIKQRQDSQHKRIPAKGGVNPDKRDQISGRFDQSALRADFATAKSGLNKILRFELPCEPLHLISWLNSQKEHHKFYFSSREGDFEMAGLGLADCIKGSEEADFEQIFEHMQERLSERNPHLRYYGAIAFNKKIVSVPNFIFFIPRFEILRAGDECLFALNISLEDITESKIKRILGELQSLNFVSEELPLDMPDSVGQKNDPERQDWERIFAQAKRSIEEGSLQKIVLARKTTYEFARTLNPWIILNALKEKTPQCFHFCLMPDARTTFLGASPERLYRREGINIETEALAGTKSRGQNHEEDEKRRRDLLASAKDKEEHLFVVKFLNEALERMCSRVAKDREPSLLKQNAGYHLITRFQGTLLPKVDDAAILSTLHPTPAVGGYPQENALRLILKLEAFERGWYAGAMGFVGRETSEFCVAIRSGLIRDKELSLFAGAGIVGQSTAEGEWEEIEAKIKGFGI